MGSCSSSEESAPAPRDGLEVKGGDGGRALSKAVNYQFKLALIGDSTHSNIENLDSIDALEVAMEQPFASKISFWPISRRDPA